MKQYLLEFLFMQTFQTSWGKMSNASISVLQDDIFINSFKVCGGSPCESWETNKYYQPAECQKMVRKTYLGFALFNHFKACVSVYFKLLIDY